VSHLGFEPDTSQMQVRSFAASINLLSFFVMWVCIGAISFPYVHRIGKYYDEKIGLEILTDIQCLQPPEYKELSFSAICVYVWMHGWESR
jgi:hypothetical protein